MDAQAARLAYIWPTRVALIRASLPPPPPPPPGLTPSISSSCPGMSTGWTLVTGGERTAAVCSHINSAQPDIVFLQEVVPSTLSIFRSSLSPSFECFSAPGPSDYFPAIFVQHSRMARVGRLEVVKFPQSQMDRHLLKLPVTLASGDELLTMTSHLESLKDHAAERKRQLQVAFDTIRRATSPPEQRTCLFGGDLNVREAELRSVGGLPPDTVDVWEACGKQEEQRYTWDVSENDNLDWPYPNKPRARYDRLYLSPAEGHLQPTSFMLVGKERLSCGRFPSDHWGIEAKFAVP